MSGNAEELPLLEEQGAIRAGAFGPVLRAHDLTHDRIVSLECVTDPALSVDAAAGLIEEVRAAARLRRPYLLPILGAGMREGRPCFITPPAVNGRLAERRERFHDPRAAADLVEKLARAVAAGHAHGLLHGDLNPDGVLFDESDQPLVGDFGLAPFLLAHAKPSAPEWVRGRPAYRAPEWFTSAPILLEPTADVWSLGAILYELLTGRRPFDGADAEETIRRVRTDGPVAPRRLRHDLDGELEAVVLRCLQKKRDDRYGSARALADDLERWLRAEPTEARPEPWWRRLLRAL